MDHMKLAIGGDSAGEPLVKVLVAYLKERDGIDVSDLSKPEDGGDEYYANLADRVASAVIDGAYDKGILVCGTGIGVCISANKVNGIRAALTHDTYSAERAALSNDAQIITMGARVIGPELAKAVADAFLAHAGQFDEKGRSAGNVRAINELDGKYRNAG